MPSWNIHTAHVERLLADWQQEQLGVEDANAFLFGNYVPDVYVGFMVPDTTYRLGYLLTHMAKPHVTPIPNADLFWDFFVSRREPPTAAGRSLVLGAWAHLVTDRYYNGRFRTFAATHETPEGEQLRKCKQADFDLFGRHLGISSHVRKTPELVEAAGAFVPYSILPADIERSIAVASGIVRDSAAATSSARGSFQLLDEEWLTSTFDACDERLATWLAAWRRLKEAGEQPTAAAIRHEAGLPPATPDE